MRRRAGPPGERPGYEGMGLGLFIAKTLLERSGATLSFGNGTPAAEPGPPEFARPSGAVVTVVWPRTALAPEPSLGERADPVAGGAAEAAVPGRTDRRAFGRLQRAQG